MSRWRNKPLEANTKFSTRCSGEHQELCLWGDTRWLRHLVNLWIRQKLKTSVSLCFPQNRCTQMNLRSQEHDWVIPKQRASSLKASPAATRVSLTRSRTGNNRIEMKYSQGVQPRTNRKHANVLPWSFYSWSSLKTISGCYWKGYLLLGNKCVYQRGQLFPRSIWGV